MGYKKIEYANQVISFSGFTSQSGSPMDIDGVEDYHGKLFTFFEGKHSSDIILPDGQRKCYSNLIDALKPDCYGVCIVFRHSVPIDQPIDMAVQRVTEMYSTKTKRWTRLSHLNMTVQEVYNKSCQHYFNTFAPKINKASADIAAEKVRNLKKK